jgi:hypothetical protein
MIRYDLLSKKEITKAVLDSIPKEINPYHYTDLNFDKLIFDWWFTPSNPCLRLTDIGENGFRLADIEYYEFDWPAEMKVALPKTLLYLCKKIKCPYYISAYKKIRVYDNSIAIMVKLHGGIFDYVSSQD